WARRRKRKANTHGRARTSTDRHGRARVSVFVFDRPCSSVSPAEHSQAKKRGSGTARTTPCGGDRGAALARATLSCRLKAALSDAGALGERPSSGSDPRAENISGRSAGRLVVSGAETPRRWCTRQV